MVMLLAPKKRLACVVNGLIWHVLEAPVVPDVQRMDNASSLSTIYYPVDSVAGFVKPA